MRKNKRAARCAMLLAIVAMTASAHAEVRLPKIFGSHMVLQQDKPVVVWGWANAGEDVSISLGDTHSKATANDKGEWKATLPAAKAGGQPLTMKISSTNTITFDDILVGEVWVCSGQSNMEFGIGMLQNAAEEIAQANYPNIRLMKVTKDWKPTPLTDFDGQWKPCSPETVKQGGWNGFTAVGYFFGRELHKDLNVPVGLIDATWGGTCVQSWTPPEGFAAVPALSKDYSNLQMGIPGTDAHNAQLTKTIEAVDAWKNLAQQSLSNNTLPPQLPTLPPGLLGPNDVQSSTALYNAMIHPMVPFAIRGAIWYQGESNEAEGNFYAERMKGLITGWRSIWNEGDFPFYFVQIAPYNYGNNNPKLPELWEGQAMAEKAIPNSGMVVTNDIGNLRDIHPADKQDVGHRLAQRALQDTYGRKEVVGHSPTYKSMSVDGSQVRVTFENAGTGLKSRDDKPLTHFEIADADKGVFVKADAKIDGDSVILTSDEVKTPAAMRFAWAWNAEPNLANSAGLPAGAFRAGSIPVKDSITPNVPELKDYMLVYDLDLSKVSADIQYAVDNHAAVTSFDRVAYALELKTSDGDQWVYVSMDAFTNDGTKIGVPTINSGENFQQNVSNMNVYSNVKGITTGEHITGGNIEFWPNNYEPSNSAGVPGASDQTFDFGDHASFPPDGYGSMQVHNHDARQTLLAINHWREGDQADLGIGNSTTENSDWTFAKNAGQYVTKRLRIFVRPKK